MKMSTFNGSATRDTALQGVFRLTGFPKIDPLTFASPSDAYVNDGLSRTQKNAYSTQALNRSGSHAAVDHYGLPSHEARGIRAEKGHGTCDLIGLADPP